MKALVTGGTGTLGRLVVPRLQDAGYDVRVLSRRSYGGPEGIETVAADALFILIGAVPRADWLPPEIERDERGFIVSGPSYETSVPGVFAIGDVRAGSVKRVASAVGEGSVVIQHVHRYLESVEARSHAGI